MNLVNSVFRAERKVAMCRPSDEIVYVHEGNPKTTLNPTPSTPKPCQDSVELPASGVC